jgi:hypothetical protein
MGLPRRLLRAVDEFSRQYPALATPAGARSMCQFASDAFCRMLFDRGYAVSGEAMVDEIAVVNGVSHYAVLWEGYIFDWTARQFNPKALFPEITKEIQDDPKQDRR